MCGGNGRDVDGLYNTSVDALKGTEIDGLWEPRIDPLWMNGSLFFFYLSM